MTNLIGNWNYPTTVKMGVGRIKELGDLCKSVGMKRPLLVTDPGLVKLGVAESVREICVKAGLGVEVFADVKSNPTGENVIEGVKLFRECKHDGVIALGGGSALDAAKAIALMSGQECSLWDFVDDENYNPAVKEEGIVQTIAIPTTAGTGSEVGRASVITDTDTHSKKIIFHPKMMPSVVILDPELTIGLPPKLTAATGMDALSHLLEAYCAPGYHPQADGIALEGIYLIKEWLPIAYKDPDNLEARSHMLVASMMGATAFQKGLGGMHALAHSLGGMYDAHHGMLNAVLMPYVLVMNHNEISEKMAGLARIIGLKKYSLDGVLDWVLALREELGIPHTLSEIGIDSSQSAEVAKRSAVDPAAGGNPLSLTPEILEPVFIQAVNGEILFEKVA